MIVDDVLPDIKKVTGTCDLSENLRFLNSATELLEQESNWDSNIGFVDVCTDGCILTLMDDVEMPLAINVGGRPSSFRNRWYEHHLNGPGSECCNENSSWAWEHQGLFPCFRDIKKPSLLGALCEKDEGPDKWITVFGEDIDGKPLYDNDGTGQLVPGLKVPMIFGVFSGVPEKNCPLVSRITQVVCPKTLGFKRLIAYDDRCEEGSLIGYYTPEETAPAYRRIKLSGSGCQNLAFIEQRSASTHWVRMRYRRKQKTLTGVNDMIFLASPMAIKSAVQAVKKYEEDLSDEGDKYIARAVAFLESKEKSLSGPNQGPIQFQATGFGADNLENFY